MFSQFTLCEICACLVERKAIMLLRTLKGSVEVS